MKFNKEEFLKTLDPYMDRIPYVEESQETYGKLYSESRRSSHMDFETFKKRVIENRRVLAARVLKAIEESWAPYETPRSLAEELILTPPFEVGENFTRRLAAICRFLAIEGLVESQGDRFRKLSNKD